MPLRLKIKEKFTEKSERVNCVDLHPEEPWILASLDSGTLCIWIYQTHVMAQSFEVTHLPVRSAKFIARKQWAVAGADDKRIHVYDYNTMRTVKVFEAHSDFIRSVAVHPTLPYVLSSSDDMLIKLWDWEKGWACTQIFQGHSHSVMQVTFNPKDTNTFASASLDCTIKIWNLGSPNPSFTLDAHQKGVNCVDYVTVGDKPYLITGSDDHTAKVWDYQTKSCVQTLDGHTHNVSAVCIHPELPIIITGSEDGTVRIWDATTYRLENTLNYGLEKVWAIGYIESSRRVVIGCDEGTIMVKLGRASMDNTGQIISADIRNANIKSTGADYEVADGESLPLPVKEVQTCDLDPQDEEEPFAGWTADDYELKPSDRTWEIDMSQLCFGKLLKSGTCWDVYEGTYRTKKESVAIKVLKPKYINNETLKKLSEQLELMRNLSHRNLVNFVGGCNQKPVPCVVTEFGSRGTLHTPIYKFSWITKYFVQAARDAAEAMEFLHANDVVHGNLKTENLLYGNPIQVCDFWVSKVTQPWDASAAEGNAYRWIAPEVLKNSPSDEKSDVYSYGYALSELISGDGDRPIPDKFSEGMYMEKAVCPEKLKALIQSCRRQDPGKRPSFSEVVETLKEIQEDRLEEIRMEEIREEEEEIREEEEALADYQAFVAKLPFFKDKVVLMPSAEHQATVVWLQDTTEDSVDFVKDLGLPNVKWICPEVYLNYWGLDKDLKRLEQDIVKFLKDEPEHVLKVVSGRGEGSGMALYFATRWALGVHPIKLGAVLGINGLPPHRELLESIREVEGSSDRAASLHVEIGISRIGWMTDILEDEKNIELKPGPWTQMVEAKKYIKLLRSSGFEDVTLRGIYGDVSYALKSYLMDAIKKTFD
ncbi:Serine-threonine/tyrosine-protein kinase [Hirschfeldia incana]|nr:Serine-threonine/tyrosine-protein kinase [Hirschfeldia incana]